MYSSLQALRAAAALMVVLFHLGGTFAQTKYFGVDPLGGAFGWGDAGVDFFFVLSGFLIATVHRREFGRPEALPRYIYKRVVRIYPTYWIVCFAVCAAAFVVPELRAALPSDPWVFVKALLLLPQDPDVVGGTGSPILFVAWSLQYEMMFYAVFAAFIANRALGAMFALGLLATSLGCQLGSGCAFPASFVANNMVLLFAMGVAAAFIAHGRWRMPAPRAVALAAAAAFVGFGMFEVHVGHDALGFDRRLVFGALAALVIVALVQAEDAGAQVAKSRWMALLGDSSYALYLLHMPVISVVAKLFAHVGLVRPLAVGSAAVAVVFACVGSALVFHLAIEKPLLARLRFDRRRAPPRVASAMGPRT